MSPKEYYYNQFPNDLKVVLNKVVLGGDGHFHILEFFINPKNKRDVLKHIQKENLGYFLSALTGTILIDQVIFTYFKKDYEEFRSMTLYPKITWSIGWCVNVKPWQLFEHRIALARGLQNPEKSMTCIICKNGKTQPGHTTVALTRGETTVVIKELPAEICDNCGEPYLDEEMTGWVLERAEKAVSQGVEVEIVRYAA